MSERYDRYLDEHKVCVAMAYRWIEEHIPDILDPSLFGTYEWNCCYSHDASKTDVEEYEAYDNYFYGNQSHAVVQEFERGWLHHIHENPHHWQHWILFEDDPTGNKPYKALDMPEAYILEMICDWWSFSFRSGNLFEIFDWYDAHKGTMILSDKTRKRVEYILGKIKDELGAPIDVAIVVESDTVPEVVGDDPEKVIE